MFSKSLCSWTIDLHAKDTGIRRRPPKPGETREGRSLEPFQRAWPTQHPDSRLRAWTTTNTYTSVILSPPGSRAASQPQLQGTDTPTPARRRRRLRVRRSQPGCRGHRHGRGASHAGVTFPRLQRSERCHGVGEKPALASTHAVDTRHGAWTSHPHGHREGAGASQREGATLPCPSEFTVRDGGWKNRGVSPGPCPAPPLLRGDLQF